MSDEALREHLSRLLDWGDAHTTYEAAVEGIEPHQRTARAQGVPYSLWQLLEHMRRTQRDILDFCRDPDYEEPNWPDDYWPAADEIPSDEEWSHALQGFLRDRAELVMLAEDREIDLYARIPHGTGQTYLRELLLAADHNAYHLGELVVLRRALGAWSGA
jgi:uncharacterized damage-inducible protein DinB